MVRLMRRYLKVLLLCFTLTLLIASIRLFSQHMYSDDEETEDLPVRQIIPPSLQEAITQTEKHMFVAKPMSTPPKPNSLSVASLSQMGSECSTSRSQNGSLSIHMVVVPFLNFNITNERIEAREAEYKHVLQKNLAHPLVQCVHLLTTNYTETAQRFKDLTGRSRMLVSEVGSIDLARDPFEYISKNLLGRDAMFANADIYLGKGFERVDPTLMDKEKIVYALTRRVAQEDRCGAERSYTDTDKCMEAKYIGSHDVLFFRLHEPLSEEFLEPLGFDLVSPGIENVLIWLFRKRLKYCPLNPCSVLEAFHYHMQ